MLTVFCIYVQCNSMIVVIHIADTGAYHSFVCIDLQ